METCRIKRENLAEIESFRLRREVFREDGDNIMDFAKEPNLLKQYKRQSVSEKKMLVRKIDIH